MLINCGTINDRNVLYCNLDESLTETEKFPDSNWLLFAIADKDQLGLLYSFAERCLDKGVLYICGVGEACSEIDDAFDFVMVDRKLELLKRELTEDDFEDSPMTIWDDDFDAGFWFASTMAYHEKQKIEQVIVANMTTKSYESQIKKLVGLISAGWFPPD